jgi:hypothetical protein
MASFYRGVLKKLAPVSQKLGLTPEQFFALTAQVVAVLLVPYLVWSWPLTVYAAAWSVTLTLPASLVSPFFFALFTLDLPGVLIWGVLCGVQRFLLPLTLLDYYKARRGKRASVVRAIWIEVVPQVILLAFILLASHGSGFIIPTPFSLLVLILLFRVKPSEKQAEVTPRGMMTEIEQRLVGSIILALVAGFMLAFGIFVLLLYGDFIPTAFFAIFILGVALVNLIQYAPLFRLTRVLDDKDQASTLELAQSLGWSQAQVAKRLRYLLDKEYISGTLEEDRYRRGPPKDAGPAIK